jgi:hypothetical protein
MKYRIITQFGGILPVAHSLMDEGVDVDVCQYSPITDHDVNYVSTWDYELTTDTVFIIDFPGTGKIVDILLKNEYVVLDGGLLNDRFQFDTNFVKNICSRFGIEMAEMFQSEDFNIVLEWVNQKNNRRFIKKTDTSFKAMEYENDQIISLSGYYVNGILRYLYSYIDINDITLLRFWKNKCPKIYRMTLQKIELFLNQFKYNGLLTCNIQIGQNRTKVIGWDTQIPHKIVLSLLEAVNQPYNQWLLNTVSGNIKEPSYEWHGQNGNIISQNKVLTIADKELKQLRQWKYL